MQFYSQLFFPRFFAKTSFFLSRVDMFLRRASIHRGQVNRRGKKVNFLEKYTKNARIAGSTTYVRMLYRKYSYVRTSGLSRVLESKRVFFNGKKAAFLDSGQQISTEGKLKYLAYIYRQFGSNFNTSATDSKRDV